GPEAGNAEADVLVRIGFIGIDLADQLLGSFQLFDPFIARSVTHLLISQASYRVGFVLTMHLTHLSCCLHLLGIAYAPCVLSPRPPGCPTDSERLGTVIRFSKAAT